MTCEEVRDLAPAYVLGALEADEEHAVRAHLASCSEAHYEFAELGSVIPAFAESIELVEPSPMLRARILTAAAEDLAAREAAAARPAAAPAAGPAAARAPDATAPTMLATAAPAGGRVVDLGATRLARRPFRLSWVAGVAAVMAIAVLGVWNVGLRSDLASAQAYREQVDSVLAAAGQPGGSMAILTSADDPNRSGLAAIDAQGSVHVVMRGLAPTSAGQVYEAWVIAGQAAPKPIGSFTVGKDGTGYLATDPGPGAVGDTVALTLEPGPGALTPTLPIISSGVAGRPS